MFEQTDTTIDVSNVPRRRTRGRPGLVARDGGISAHILRLDFLDAAARIKDVDPNSGNSFSGMWPVRLTGSLHFHCLHAQRSA